MKKITTILIGCAACLLMPVSADETPLAKQMDAFDDTYKAFRKETDSVKGAVLAREAQDIILKGIAELPAMVSKMPDGTPKAKAAAEYRRMMGQLFVALCEIEEAFLADNTAAVAKIVETLRDMKKEGHNKFMEDE